ncbi:MAG TPA: vWA domain-containing protein, partial [Dermatophilaceae bacterium]
MTGSNPTSARLRSVGVTLLTVGLLAAGSLATVVSSASAAPAPGDVSISDVQVTPTGVSAILTARTAGGAKIDPASVKATIGGSAAVVKVQPIAAERRVTTLLIDTSGSMGATGMATVVRAADSFLATAPADVYVGVVAFSTVPKVVAAPTLNRATVRTAVAALQSQGETSLFDAIAVALSQLGTTGDRSFILLSDGGDTRSRRTLAQTLAALSAFGVRAQVVGFKTSETQGSVLAQLASAGHGSVAAAGNDAAVSAAFKMAAQDLGSQVRVVITAPAGVGGLQPLKVTATAGGKALASVTSVDLAVVSPPPSASPAPSAAPAPAPVVGSALATAKGPLGIAWVLWFALLAIFVGVGGVIIALGTPAAGSRRQRRLESIERYV